MPLAAALLPMRFRNTSRPERRQTRLCFVFPRALQTAPVGERCFQPSSAGAGMDRWAALLGAFQFLDRIPPTPLPLRVHTIVPNSPVPVPTPLVPSSASPPTIAPPSRFPFHFRSPGSAVPIPPASSLLPLPHTPAAPTLSAFPSPFGNVPALVLA